MDPKKTGNGNCEVKYRGAPTGGQPEPQVPAQPAGTPTGNVSNSELIKKILEQHDTFKDILNALTEVVSRLGTIPKPELNYYDTPQTVIAVATPTQPNSPDTVSNATTTPPIQGYQLENVYTTLTRIAPKITVINDGTTSLFVITTPDGKNWSSEVTILTGEARTFFNVWALGIRGPAVGVISPLSGGVYRATERDFWLAYTKTISSQLFTPIQLGLVHNVAQPVANADIFTTLFGAPLTPVNTPTAYRIEVAMSNAGNFLANVVNPAGGGGPAIVTFNVIPGPALVANGLYVFDMDVSAGDVIDFRYSATGGTILILRVYEIDAAVQ